MNLENIQISEKRLSIVFEQELSKMIFESCQDTNQTLFEGNARELKRECRAIARKLFENKKLTKKQAKITEGFGNWLGKTIKGFKRGYQLGRTNINAGKLGPLLDAYVETSKTNPAKANQDLMQALARRGVEQSDINKILRQARRNFLVAANDATPAAVTTAPTAPPDPPTIAPTTPEVPRPGEEATRTALSPTRRRGPRYRATMKPDKVQEIANQITAKLQAQSYDEDTIKQIRKLFFLSLQETLATARLSVSARAVRSYIAESESEPAADPLLTSFQGKFAEKIAAETPDNKLKILAISKNIWETYVAPWIASIPAPRPRRPATATTTDPSVTAESKIIKEVVTNYLKEHKII